LPQVVQGVVGQTSACAASAARVLPSCGVAAAPSFMDRRVKGHIG
jgi:hypothetical protein